MNEPKWTAVTEYQPPDHPWDPDLAVEEWCGICGQTQLVHDGNLDRAFDFLRRIDPHTAPVRSQQENT